MHKNRQQTSIVIIFIWTQCNKLAMSLFSVDVFTMRVSFTGAKISGIVVKVAIKFLCFQLKITVIVGSSQNTIAMLYYINI